MTDHATAPLVDGERARIVDAPLAPPSGGQGLLEVFRQRYLLRLLVSRELRARYQGSFLGLVWSYIQPLFQFLIFFFIMGKVVGLGDRVENFAIHLFAGMAVVHLFTETFGAGTRSIVGNKALVRKMAMPREMFPVASLLVSAYHTIPQLVILFIASLSTGWRPDAAGMGAMLLCLAIAGVLGLALALMFSVLNVYFRDFGRVVNILTTTVRFTVPMIYPFELVASRFHNVEAYLLNPIAIAVLLNQRAAWVGTTSDPEAVARTALPDHLFTRGFGALGFALVMLVIGQIIFTRLEAKVPERL